MIEKTIRECEGNLSVVAARLGISRQTLYNKIKRYGFNSSLKFEIMAKQLYVASQRVL